ncbi:MAG: hypothetical protein KJO07_17400 [Deltaproteobacteria bacterium]|jgi:hypothetical protein|nr:hypothetical protein [Deltaproteobacteria bacterium]
MRTLSTILFASSLLWAVPVSAQPGEEEGANDADQGGGGNDQPPPPPDTVKKEAPPAGDEPGWVKDDQANGEGSDEGDYGDQPAGADAAAAATDGAPKEAVLRLYVVTSRNTYARFPFDIYDVASGDLIESGVTPDIAAGDEVLELRLAPGTYKIVRQGDPRDALVDFATVEVDAETLTDYVIVIDPDTYAFRGAGVVSGELPKGVKVAGLRIALTGGAGANLGYRRKVVGTTPGLTSQLSLFGNFSLLFDRGPHHLQVVSDLNLALSDPAFGKPYSSFDQFSGSALYTFKINNPWVGPYARAGFLTRIYPGYLFLDNEDEGTVVDVNIVRRDGTVENRLFGTSSNLDDLRIKLSKPFGPFILTEEIGANLKALDLDLFILDVHIASRLGYGIRQGLTQDLLVVDGDDEGTPITLREVGNYYTHGPVIGADAKVSFARWLYGQGSFAAMAPIKDRDEAGDNFAERLLIDLAGTAGLKLPAFTSFLYASFDYTFRLTRDGYLTSNTQFDQILMARLNLKIF